MQRIYKHLFLIVITFLIGCSNTDSEISIRTKAAKGEKEAQYRLAIWYDNGLKDGVPKNHEKSAYWYSKAADQGHVKSQYSLAEKYLSGDGVIQDLNKAIYWHMKSASQGYSPSQRALSSIYMNKDSNFYNSQKALYWMTKAAETGNGTAQFILGKWYSEGKNTEKDFYLAYIWFDLAYKRDPYEYIKYERFIMETKLTEDQLKRARKASNKWDRGESISYK